MSKTFKYFLLPIMMIYMSSCYKYELEVKDQVQVLKTLDFVMVDSTYKLYYAQITDLDFPDSYKEILVSAKMPNVTGSTNANDYNLLRLHETEESFFYDINPPFSTWRNVFNEKSNSPNHYFYFNVFYNKEDKSLYATHRFFLNNRLDSWASNPLKINFSIVFIPN